MKVALRRSGGYDPTLGRDHPANQDATLTPREYNRRGRPRNRRPVDAAYDELDPDAEELLSGGATDRDARDLALSATSRMYADRRSEF